MLNMVPVRFELSLAPADPVTMIGSPGADTYFTGPHCTQTPFAMSVSPKDHLRMKQVTVLICITPLHVRGNLCWFGGTVVSGITAEGGAWIAGITISAGNWWHCCPVSIVLPNARSGHWSGAYALLGTGKQGSRGTLLCGKSGQPLMAHILKLSV